MSSAIGDRHKVGDLLKQTLQYLPNDYPNHRATCHTQGMPPIHDVRLQWRSVMLMIAGHLDSKVPLTRVVCISVDPLPASTTVTSSTGNKEKLVTKSLQKEASSLTSGQMCHHQGVVMDIETIKWCHPEQPPLGVPGEEEQLEQ